MKRLFRRCGHAPGALSPEDQAAVDQFRALLAALRDPERWTPGHCQDLAVRVGPFVERAHPRPGDDHGPDIIAVALQHPGGSYTPYGARYRKLGWLRCETDKILGAWKPAYEPLTHAAADLDLPDDVGMAPANYGVHVEARRSDGTGYTLLRLGPYFQTWLAGHDADRLNTELAGKAATVVPGFTVTAKAAPFDVSDHESYDDPYETDAAVLLAAAIAREVPA
ncbi:hypothetical protein [Streptomyces mirabilis]|uniref:hypothetical protein n=1 Tax=Streptomyces mirabilis TaxID=68239 RepID=UPI00224DF97B|nr:hypothetical protein [Streptomyces mirabilis]MCX4425905.1 hypothetical protein [Streptomyces mirabilis]MCX4429340.1 hypothetical protein [Streptomyces mirabilis]